MSLQESYHIHIHSQNNLGDLDTPDSEDDIEPEPKDNNTNSQQGI